MAGRTGSRHGVHNNPFLGWNAPAEDVAWLEAEVERLGGGRGVKSALLTEGLRLLRAKRSGAKHPVPALPVVEDEPRRTRHALTCKCGICKLQKEGQQ
jgi:hypothetical protein